MEDEWEGHVLNLVRGDKLASLYCVAVSEDTRLHKQAATRSHEAGERRYEKASNENSFTHCKTPIEKSQKSQKLLKFCVLGKILTCFRRPQLEITGLFFKFFWCSQIIHL